MNRLELTAFVAQRLQVSRTTGAGIVDAVLDGIASGLRSGDSVALMRFGTFEVRERKARQVRNPRSGEIHELQPSRAVCFRPGKTLREVVEDDGEPQAPPAPA